MRRGEIVLELDDRKFTGRMPIPALEFVQERTGKHPVRLVDAFEADEDLPSWSDFILIAGLRGGGMDLALAEELVSGENCVFVPFAEKRMIALALLIAGLYAPAPDKAAEPAKKPRGRLISWISRSFEVMRCSWGLLRKSVS